MTRRALRVGAGTGAALLTLLILLTQVQGALGEPLTLLLIGLATTCTVVAAGHAAASPRFPSAAAAAGAIVGASVSSMVWPQLSWWGLTRLAEPVLTTSPARPALLAAAALTGQLAGVAVGTLLIAGASAVLAGGVGWLTLKDTSRPRPPADHPVGEAARLAAAMPLAVLSLASTVAFVLITLPRALSGGAVLPEGLTSMTTIVGLSVILPMLLVVAWSWFDAGSGMVRIARGMAARRAGGAWETWAPLAGLTLVCELILADHAARSIAADGTAALRHGATAALMLVAVAAAATGARRTQRPLPPLPGEEVIDAGLLTWLGITIVGGVPLIVGLLSQHGSMHLAELARHGALGPAALAAARGRLTGDEVATSIAFTHVRLALTVVPWVAVSGLAAWLASHELPSHARARDVSSGAVRPHKAA